MVQNMMVPERGKEGEIQVSRVYHGCSELTQHGHRGLLARGVHCCGGALLLLSNQKPGSILPVQQECSIAALLDMFGRHKQKPEKAVQILLCF